MSRFKDLYMVEFEKRYNENLDRGMKEDAAYTEAGETAYDRMRETLEEKADRLRQQKRDDAMCEKVDGLNKTKH